MIGYLKGILIQKKPNMVLLDVHGVGYVITIPVSAFYDLPDEGNELSLFIHTHVREDILALYGFRTTSDKSLFEKLITVSNVGPKMAISFLSGLTANELIPAIQRQDILKLTSIPGVGRKTAERVCLELREQLPVLLSEAAVEHKDKPAREDLISALVNLGYHRSVAERTVKTVLDQSKSEDSFEVLLRNSLQNISA